MLTHVNATVQGISTIRALSGEDFVTKEFENQQSIYNSNWLFYGSSSIALSFFVDLTCFLFLSFTTIFLILYGKDSIPNAGLLAMVLTQVVGLSALVQFGIREIIETSTQLIAVERISRYDDLEEEDKELDESEDKEYYMSPDWPNRGEIKFYNVSLRYDNILPAVLRNLNFNIESREKIGIVGRTGAGKSSLIAAIFRLYPVEGKIEIDGIDTRDIPLTLLRSKIAIIPQNPVLFAGTLRQNLDPFGEYDDHVLNEAIHAVELKDSTNTINDLDYQVISGGTNYSVGQRQLICLARALVRNNKILILDEATANVDFQTDDLIQNTIKKQFSHCTVLTVAHRLNTVIDSDRIMVIEGGLLVEFDHPYVLLQNPDGIFFKMIYQNGNKDFERLKIIAYRRYMGLNDIS
ncbi:hypothetical protein HHI36_006607 [Cryptolaemus montrouzieri]|uniref:Uncharacterized protein n=1 Tax=Cryptolaemus montrouzieri TaxID=559131 RepID=A0ABD2NY31_9CUCU